MSVGGNHGCHNAKLLNQPTEKERERERAETARGGENKAGEELSVEQQTTLVDFMRRHSYFRPLRRSNLPRQMFLLVLIESELTLGGLKI